MTLINLEKYLAGEPLNEELKALKEGRQVAVEPWHSPYAAQAGLAGGIGIAAEEALRPLSAQERAALRDIRQGPGWFVLQKLLERATLLHTKSATVLSEDDPLGKSEEIGRLWHNLKVWKLMVAQLNAAVEVELAAVEPKPIGQND